MKNRLVAALLTTCVLVASTACSRDATDTGGTDTATREVSNSAAPPGTPMIRLTQVAQLKAPVAMTPRPGGPDLYVAEQGGTVKRIKVTTASDGSDSYAVDSGAVLDLSEETKASGERGLLGLAFSPDGKLLYVDYTDIEGDSHVVEYAMKGDHADTSSARELFFVDQPFPNHNGGQLAFGPDGFLYIGFGDGGSGGDPDDRAQDAGQLLGKVLRIDPSGRTGDLPYAIPPDNPFADGVGGRPEIWLYGVRNPWRFSFDRTNGDLWVADVGQDQWEEIDHLPATPQGAGRGDNLGWPFFEATHPFKGDAPEGLVAPVYEYSHTDGGCSIIGGYVYRGSAIPSLVGTYLFGDYCLADVDGLQLSGEGQGQAGPLGVSVAANSLSSFGQDQAGELYVLSSEGPVFKVVAS